MRTLSILILFVASVCDAASTQADFYLSLNGNDTWSGKLASPNPEETDGPFATLARARDAVRLLKKSKKSDILVLLRGGTYQLDKTVEFGLQDSGEGDSTVTYAAHPGETPVFSSGREIKGWKKVPGKLPGLPDEAQGNVLEASVSGRFLTLYDAEGMLPRAQSERFLPRSGGSKMELRFPKGRLKNWSNVEDVEILVRPTRAWTMNVLPLVSVDEERGVARTAIPATYGMNKYGCWVENVLEELDQPGEWALNTKEGKVYLWPRGKSPVMAPQLIEFIRVEGKIDKRGPKDTPVRNLCFRGLTFKHGERYTLAKADAGLQHDWDMLDKGNALVRLRGTESCVVEQCHFLHSGSGAIRVDLHGIENNISGNRIEYMGGGGILLCGYGPGTKDVNKKNLVYNNHIHHIGEIYWHSPGIYICQSGQNRVANNLIHHTNYTALIVSGIVSRFFVRQDKRESVRTVRWHEIGKLPRNPDQDALRPYLHTRNNLIELNEIHHAMQILGDGNGIYIRGAGSGNVIRRNYVHHLVAKTNAQGAIRTDGGQMDTLIAENLIYKCKSQGMTLKLNNRFENNIIADVIAPRGTYLKIVEGPMQGASNKRNIFYSSTPDCTFISEPGSGKGKVGEDRRGRVAARMKHIESDHNIYYCKADRSRGETVLKKLQGDGVDANSLAVDPMFVDPESGDFRLKQHSPALKLGFVPIDQSKIGLRSDTRSVDAPGSAQNAWVKLVGNRFSRRPEFAFVENNPALPNVLIYGDSISIQYTQRLRAKLKGQASVYRLYCNGGDSGSFIEKMKKMHTAMRDEQLDKPWMFQWDVIQFNVGLHDFKYLVNRKLDKKNGKQVTPIDRYKKNLDDIVMYLQQLAFNANLIFATTTPVPEGAAGRIAGDAQRYNVAALEVLSKAPDIAVNDLFSFTKPNQPQWCSKPGDVHFNQAGRNAQGDEVARIILSTLAERQ